MNTEDVSFLERCSNVEGDIRQIFISFTYRLYV